MNETKYLIDTNALIRLSWDQRSGGFVASHCRLISDVLREAEGFPDHAALTALDFPIDAEVLESVREVMSSVDPSDTELLNLYRYEGTADPVLIATAIVAGKRTHDQLWQVRWVIVTDDKAVEEKALEFGISTMGFDQFVALLE